jgi:hypothetical protein
MLTTPYADALWVVGPDARDYSPRAFLMISSATFFGTSA